jgi:uncharacterized protein (TIGR02246 family)
VTQHVEQIALDVAVALERAWNAGDGAEFAARFAEDADFVNIRGEHYRTRDVIARGHQAIFDSICKGSVVRYQPADVREIGAGVFLFCLKSVLNAPVGPLAGQHRALATVGLVQDKDDWRIASFHNTLVA